MVHLQPCPWCQILKILRAGCCAVDRLSGLVPVLGKLTSGPLTWGGCDDEPFHARRPENEPDRLAAEPEASGCHVRQGGSRVRGARMPQPRAKTYSWPPHHALLLHPRIYVRAVSPCLGRWGRACPPPGALPLPPLSHTPPPLYPIDLLALSHPGLPGTPSTLGLWRWWGSGGKGTLRHCIPTNRASCGLPSFSRQVSVETL